MEEKKIWAVKDGYLVHRDGSIYKLNWKRTGTMRKVRQTKQSVGYLLFRCNGKHVYSHRFIAECFLPNPNNLPEINHKDENKLNNCVDNLEWCDRKHNINYGTRNEKVEKTLSKKVYQYTKGGKFVKEWCSLSEIQRELGFAQPNISACCNGRLDFAYNFVWSFKPLS